MVILHAQKLKMYEAKLTWWNQACQGSNRLLKKLSIEFHETRDLSSQMVTDAKVLQLYINLCSSSEYYLIISSQQRFLPRGEKSTKQ